MEKKEYMRPLTKEVKIQANKLLSGSAPTIHNEKSNNASYSREGRGSSWDDED